MDAKSVYCDPIKLKQFLLVENSKYVSINDNNIDKFWEKTSNYLCQSSLDSLSGLTTNLPSKFVIPKSIKDVKLRYK